MTAICMRVLSYSTVSDRQDGSNMYEDLELLHSVLCHGEIACVFADVVYKSTQLKSYINVTLHSNVMLV